MKTVAAALGIIACIPVAVAAGKTAEQTVDACRLAIASPEIKSPNSDQAMDIGYCLGVMEGLRAGNHFLQQEKSKMAYCAPDDVLNEDLARIFVAAVDIKPSLRPVRASVAAQIVFSKVYPCNGK